MRAIGFDNEKYLEEQRHYILERVKQSDGKLYLECGGKLLFDYHASRVLPGFDPNVKMRVFQSLKEQIDVIICIHSGDIERRKMRSDFGITYDTDVFKMIDDFSKWGLKVTRVVITRFDEEPGSVHFKNILEQRGITVYTHRATHGYPNNVDLIVSDEGYGANPYIETDRPVVIVTGPGPGSGKLGTCLSQMYHDYRAGRHSGYSKFETFPIWNLPIDHPVNIAYESATADIGDKNLIDHFHASAYNQITVNYSRDLEAYPLLNRILSKITGKECLYKSPTDMGVNRCGFGIIDDEVVRKAGEQEIIRRYYRAACEYVQGIGSKVTVERSLSIMEGAKLSSENRNVVPAAKHALERGIERNKGINGIVCAAAIELPDGRIVTGCNSPFLHASSALILNAVKVLADIDHEIDLISPAIVQSVTAMKRDVLKGRGVSLNLDEVLICLAMSCAISENAKKASDVLPLLQGCEVHMTHIPSSGDSSGLRKLVLNVTSEPRFPTSSMYNPA
ncbi:DUF1846 domain-containing protein [Sphaerochaeta halotolerans]|uniref:DUF1846 domain-containing protein n=1 Tax=Sphaerochaeta halotolerans TaxID=2293840 RepID=UPI00136C86E6|nr:DUF1846 domain-containing protein [Spirochaetaceae bacterium]MDK2860538.1 hypothetical protein [Sphaerochaeta sp.]MDN5333794.1 hypothetical protein [Sphaerochaeta sp.]MXI85572.1 DUF1846 family protein [Sphaerochaeta halotolerans]